MAYKASSLFFPFLVMIFLILWQQVITTTVAVEFSVTNRASGTSGGIRFDNQIGSDYTLQILSESTNLVWQILRQNTDADRKNVAQVSTFIQSIGRVPAYTINDEIYVNADYIAGYTGDVRMEIVGVLYHEMTHVWQWNGNRQTPGWLIEGVADYVRLKSGFIPSHWVKPGQGDSWEQSYDVTARFLDYCNDLRDGFVAELNGKMIDGYSQTYFNELLGKSVDQLWSDYKARYA